MDEFVDSLKEELVKCANSPEYTHPGFVHGSLCAKPTCEQLYCRAEHDHSHAVTFSTGLQLDLLLYLPF